MYITCCSDKSLKAEMMRASCYTISTNLPKCQAKTSVLIVHGLILKSGWSDLEAVGSIRIRETDQLQNKTIPVKTFEHLYSASPRKLLRGALFKITMILQNSLSTSITYHYEGWLGSGIMLSLESMLGNNPLQK